MQELLTTRPTSLPSGRTRAGQVFAGGARLTQKTGAAVPPLKSAVSNGGAAACHVATLTAWKRKYAPLCSSPGAPGTRCTSTSVPRLGESAAATTTVCTFTRRSVWRSLLTRRCVRAS